MAASPAANLKLLTVEGAAAALSMDKMSVYRMVWAGELAWVNIGQQGKRARIRIREADLERYIQARIVPGRAA